MYIVVSENWGQLNKAKQIMYFSFILFLEQEILAQKPYKVSRA